MLSSTVLKANCSIEGRFAKVFENKTKFVNLNVLLHANYCRTNFIKVKKMHFLNFLNEIYDTLKLF